MKDVVSPAHVTRTGADRLVTFSTTSLLFAVIATAALASIFSTSRDGPINFTRAIDVILVATCVLIILRRPVSVHLVWALGFVIYFCVFSVQSLLNGESLSFIVLTSKFLIYAALFALIADARSATALTLKTIYRAFVVLLLVKYASSVALMGNLRPGLLVENNFELLTLLILATVTFGSYRMRIVDIALLFAIFAMSGSRSGAVSLLVFMLIANLNLVGVSRRSVWLLRIAALGLAIAVFALSLNTFGSGYDIFNSDRFFFLQAFLAEVESRGFGTWIWGSGALLPLQDSVCNQLNFWNGAFGRLIVGDCYSYILHSGLLRIILDHGLVVLLLIILFYYRYLGRYLGSNAAMTIVTISVLNSASVSGFNGTYFALGMLIVVLLRPNAVNG